MSAQLDCNLLRPALQVKTNFPNSKGQVMRLDVVVESVGDNAKSRGVHRAVNLISLYHHTVSSKHIMVSPAQLKDPCVVHSNTLLKDLEMICRIQVAVSKYKAGTQNKAECDNVTEESRWHQKWQEDDNPEESWLYQGKWKDEVWEAKKAD